MSEKFIAETSVVIDALPAKVWQAITTPSMIKKYLMDTNVETDWKEGSSITYTGTHEGKTYKDKGEIKRMIPEKIFASTYWSSMSGKEDTPENYNLVTYSLFEKDGKTILTLTQDNIDNEQSRNHSLQNWAMVLQQLKALVEG